MTIKVKLSSGKEIELTPEEYAELTGKKNFIIELPPPGESYPYPPDGTSVYPWKPTYPYTTWISNGVMFMDYSTRNQAGDTP